MKINRKEKKVKAVSFGSLKCGEVFALGAGMYAKACLDGNERLAYNVSNGVISELNSDVDVVHKPKAVLTVD